MGALKKVEMLEAELQTLKARLAVAEKTPAKLEEKGARVQEGVPKTSKICSMM